MRVWIGVAVVSAVLIAGVAIVDHATNRDGDTVTIVGDSITQFGTGQLRKTLGSDFQLTIDGQGGKRSDEMYSAAVALAQTKPKQAIVNLGTNDILQRVPISQSADEIQKIVELFAGAECVHVVNINTHISQDGYHPSTEADALNQRLTQLSDTHPNVDIVDWNGMVSDGIDDDPPNGFIFDGVHPTEQGQSDLADAYDDALQGCSRPWKFW